MPLIQFVIVLVCVGVLLYVVNHFVPWIDGNIKKIINGVVILCTVLWVIGLFGVFGPLWHIRIGR